MGNLTRVLALAGLMMLASVALAGEGAAVGQVVQANSDFAIDLYRQLAKENAGESLFFSPYSISSALAMAAEGARGQTAAEMGQVLRFPEAARSAGNEARPWEMALIHKGIAAINRRINRADQDPTRIATIRSRIAERRKQLEAAKKRVAELERQRNWRELRTAQGKERMLATELNQLTALVDQYEIHVANALWGEQTYPFRQDYVDTIASHYGTGGVIPCDFRTNFPAARERINAWAAKQTRDRIQDIIPELPPDQARLIRLILTNAIYFKGEWAEPFKEANTKPRDFTLADGKTVQTPIMNAQNLEVARYGAFEADGSPFDTPLRIQRGQKAGLYPDENGFAMLELPYKGGDLSMVLLAPNRPDGLAAIEKTLDAKKLAAWVGKLQKRKTHVFMPKFKMETLYKLSETLQAMGMVRAFKDPRLPNGADFTGMCASADPTLRLFISKVLHKAFVEVNEKGTEAAAVTAVMMMGATAAPVTVPFTPTFKADRPFLFLIRDTRDGTILFLGRMMNPKA
jgi:serine protease inhibitor